MNSEYIARINQYLPLLLSRIKAASNPIVINIQPETDAAINGCFYNVQRKIVKDGGRAVYGWAIRPLKYMIEAERHAVWQAPDNTYLDITPTIQPVSQTLFVIDNGFIYDGQVLDNVRVNISENKVVDDWIFVCEAIYKLYSYAHRTAENTITMPENLVPMLTGLEEFAKIFEPYLDANGNYDCLCFCGRQLSYKNCHGLDLRQPLSEALLTVENMMKKSEN
ncbi:hypothetical protein [Pedobacter sp. BAL39]|uniref:hypothetical protein n=1 Tax=Pedobacter sp. BAL39 TaxID=391596 RepID=UPI0005872EB3|nr:hypothetical protein [Pedobacter sp. BAL39]